jgi:hypothetical protein
VPRQRTAVAARRQRTAVHVVPSVMLRA